VELLNHAQELGDDSCCLLDVCLHEIDHFFLEVTFYDIEIAHVQCQALCVCDGLNSEISS